MLTLEVNDVYSLELATEGAGVRLTLTKEGTPLVCRKATRKELRDFSESASATAFKGRLILYKQFGKIEIEAKKEIIGALPLPQFEAAITAVLTGSTV